MLMALCWYVSAKYARLCTARTPDLPTSFPRSSLRNPRVFHRGDTAVNGWSAKQDSHKRFMEPTWIGFMVSSGVEASDPRNSRHFSAVGDGSAGALASSPPAKLFTACMPLLQSRDTALPIFTEPWVSLTAASEDIISSNFVCKCSVPAATVLPSCSVPVATDFPTPWISLRRTVCPASSPSLLPMSPSLDIHTGAWNPRRPWRSVSSSQYGHSSWPLNAGSTPGRTKCTARIVTESCPDTDARGSSETTSSHTWPLCWSGTWSRKWKTPSKGKASRRDAKLSGAGTAHDTNSDEHDSLDTSN
mmetsp:Transcript_18082/g.52829  ORF Transcript_18082/g.52829 Transcript_18082/m.52829 type:complete len:303 (+) Transcript_18082:357-1265(+)